MAYTISTHNGTSIAWEHNYSKKFRDKEEHIDKDREIEILEYTPIKEKYKQVFNESVQEYNSKQKRKDRKIDDYYSKIQKDKQKNVCYEMIVQVGNFQNKPSEELQDKILKEFYESFKENFPNMEIVACVLHKDEANFHLHLDYIPIKHCEKGLKTQVSMSGALSEMNYANSDKFNEQPLIQWTRDCNQLLENICVKYGLEIEHPERAKNDEQKQRHLTIKEFRDKKVIEELETKKNELEDKNKQLKNRYNKNVENYNVAITKLNNSFEQKKEELKVTYEQMQINKLELFQSFSDEINEEINSMKNDKAALQEEVEKLKEIKHIPSEEELKNKGKKNVLGKKSYSEEDLQDFFNDYKALKLENKDLLNTNQQFSEEISNLRQARDNLHRALNTQKEELNIKIEHYKKKAQELKPYKLFVDFLNKKFDLKEEFNLFQKEQSKDKSIDNDISFKR